MLGRDFGETLRAARAGDEVAFGRLWRDANPIMIRYLRVTGDDDPYDAACEGWVTVLRGLPGFAGDETAWRVWLMACARMRAEEGSLRRAWSGLVALPHPGLAGDEIGLDDLVDPGDPMDPEHRGLGDTIDAFRRLPLGQGEVLMLRLGVGLPVEAVADVVGVDPETVRRTEARGLERLATPAELLQWSLAAPPLPAELADESVGAGAFRSVPVRAPGRSAGTRIVTAGERVRAGTSRRPVSRPQPALHTVRRGDAPASSAATVSGATVIRASRGALVGAAVVCASAMTLGGLSAAAYVGALPRAIQQAAHDALGAPAPGSGAWGGRHSTSSPSGGNGGHGAGGQGSGGQRSGGQSATSGQSGASSGSASTGTRTVSVPGPASTTAGTGSGKAGSGSPTTRPSHTKPSHTPPSHTPPSHTKVSETTGSGGAAPRTKTAKPKGGGTPTATVTSGAGSTGTSTATSPAPSAKPAPTKTAKAPKASPKSPRSTS